MMPENVECWHFGASCDQCHGDVIAPKRSEYVSGHKIRHFWSCENCGHEFVISFNLSRIGRESNRMSEFKINSTTFDSPRRGLPQFAQY